MASYKTGDIVKVSSHIGVFTGILMPNEYTDTIVIKLDNGYNIGLEKKKVNGIKLEKEYEPRKDHTEKPKVTPGLPTVSIVSTGGTISSKVDYRTGGAYANYTAEDFVQMCPELSTIANINARKVMSVMS